MADIAVFGLALDYSGFDQAERKVEEGIDRLEKKLDSATAANKKLDQEIKDGIARGLRTLASQLGQTDEEFAKFLGRYRSMETATDRGRLVLSQFGKTSLETRTEIARLSNELDKLIDRQRRLGNTPAASAAPNSGPAGDAADKASGQVKKLKDEVGGLTDKSRAAQQALNAVQGALNGTGVSADDAIDAVGGLGSAFGALGVGIGIAAGVTAGLFAIAKSTADSIAKYDDLAQKTGLQVETLSALDVQLGKSGVNIDTFAGGVQKLSSRLDEAQRGNKKAREEFQKLGIELGGGTDQALRQIVARYKDLPDQQQKTTYATKLFGDAGKDLVPVLNSLDGDLDGYMDRMRELGLVVTPEAVAQAKEFKDRTEELNRQIEGLKITIGTGVLPVLTNYTTGLSNALSFTRQLGSETITFKDGLEAAAKAAINLISFLNPSPTSISTRLIFGPDRPLQPKRSDRTGGLPDIEDKPKRTGEGVFRSIRESELANERALADQRIAIARGAEARQTQILEAQLADRLISVRDYYDARQKLTDEATQAEIASEREKITALNRQITEAQRGGVTKREQAEILNARAKIVGVETRIIELQDRAAAGATRNAREQAQALRELDDAAAEVQERLQELTGNQAQAAIDATNRRIDRQIQQFLVNGRTEAANQAEQLRQVLNTRSAAAGYGDRDQVRQQQLSLDILRIQNDLNQGMIGEGQARERILRLERESVAARESGLRTQLLLTESAGDQQGAARIREQIELLRQLGRDELDLLRRRAAGGFLNDEAFTDTARLRAEQARLRGMENLAQRIIDLEDQIANAGIDSALRIKEAYLSATAEILDADTRAAAERIRNQVKLADIVSGRINPERLNDGVLRVLASQKSLQQSLEDLRAGTVQDAFAGLDAGIDAVSKKLGIAGTALNQFLKDLARLALTKGLDKLLGLSTATGGVKGAIADVLGIKRDQGVSVADVVGKDALKTAGMDKIAGTTVSIDQKMTEVISLLRDLAAAARDSASCCRSQEANAASAGGGSILGSILGIATGAILGGALGGLGGGGGSESGSGFSGAPAGGYFTGSHGVRLRLSGGRDSGGPVDAGSAYLIGGGPEVFIPSTPGMIAPVKGRRSSDKPVTFNATFNISGVQDANSFRRSQGQIEADLLGIVQRGLRNQ